MSDNPFELTDIEDVKIIIKAKGKHYSIVPREGMREAARDSRIVLGWTALSTYHAVVDTALEDINIQELKDKLKP